MARVRTSVFRKFVISSFLRDWMVQKKGHYQKVRGLGVMGWEAAYPRCEESTEPRTEEEWQREGAGNF